MEQTKEEIQGIKFQAMFNQNVQEMFGIAYPFCVKECQVTKLKANDLVFQEGELECSFNCMQKHQQSLTIAFKQLFNS